MAKALLEQGFPSQVVRIQPCGAAATRFQVGLGRPLLGLSHCSLQRECGWLEEEARPEGWGGEGALATLLPAEIWGGLGRTGRARRGRRSERRRLKEDRQHGGEHARGTMSVPLACGGSWLIVPPEACHGPPGQALFAACGVCRKC